MLLFETDEFREWIEQRHAEENEGPPREPRQKCVACGTDLDQAPHRDETTCGFCLAYEFGYDTHGARVAGAISGVGKIIVSDDPGALKHLYTQLLEDVDAAI